MRNPRLAIIVAFLSILSIASSRQINVVFSELSKTRSNSNQEQESLKTEIEKVLQTQTKAWNRGDLVDFMSTYWKSKKLSFSSGGQTTYGWQETLDRYRRGYAPPKEMGTLHFDDLQVTPIESNSALVLGQWHLKMKDGSTKEGNFSLVLKRIKEEWKIIHDHSSIKEKEEKDE